MASPEPVFIAVIGAGNVGRHVLTQLSHLHLTHPHLTLVLISLTTKSLRATHPSTPLSLTTWDHDLSTSTQPPLSIPETLTFLTQLPPNRILIDNTSSQSLANAYPSFLTAGINIVTPNKKPFSSSLALWDSIHKSSHPPRSLLYHESTVGAGLPIISTLTDLLSTGDTIHRIEGVFSGTLSFLFNNFSPVTSTTTTTPWSAHVLSAKTAGFTEPDPRDDLNGLDVARKLVILARLVGLRVLGPDTFPVQSLVPQALAESEGLSVSDFLTQLPSHDASMEALRDAAVAENKVLRFVGSIDVTKEILKVGIEKVDKSSPVAGLLGSDNVVSFYTARYGDNPLVVRGAG